MRFSVICVSSTLAAAVASLTELLISIAAVSC